MIKESKPFELVAEEQKNASDKNEGKEITPKDSRKEKRAAKKAMEDFRATVRYWEWLSKDEALKARKKRIKEILGKD